MLSIHSSLIYTTKKSCGNPPIAVIKICVKILRSDSFMARSTNGVMRKVNQIWWKWQKEVNTVPWQLFVFLRFVQSYCSECKWMNIIWKTKENYQLPEHVQRETQKKNQLLVKNGGNSVEEGTSFSPPLNTRIFIADELPLPPPPLPPMPLPL